MVGHTLGWGGRGNLECEKRTSGMEVLSAATRDGRELAGAVQIFRPILGEDRGEKKKEGAGELPESFNPKPAWGQSDLNRKGGWPGIHLEGGK